MPIGRCTRPARIDVELVSDNLRLPTLTVAELLSRRVEMRIYGEAQDVPAVVGRLGT